MPSWLRTLLSIIHSLFPTAGTRISTTIFERWLATEQPTREEIIEKLGDTQMCDWAERNVTRNQLAAPIVEQGIRALLIAAADRSAARGRYLGLLVSGPTVAVLLFLIIILA